MRLPVAVDLRINKFSGASITEMESGISNGIIDSKNGKTYATQRPSIDVFADASVDIADARGRAIYYWEDEPALYILNNGTLYKNTYGGVLSTTPTAGTKKCRFFEVGTNLVLLDPENDQGFTINTSDAVAEITDTDFPPKQVPPVGLAHGGASLDTYLFVLGENGVIYHCDSLDATAWNALNFIEARREPDGGVYIGKHHDNIAVLGPSSFEFFYDAGNASGSVLSVRQDVSYNIGCSSGESVWEEGDRMFWVGPNPSGSLGVYMLDRFQISKVSNSTIDSFITQAIQRDGYSVVGSGLSGQGHIYYTVTLYTTPSDISPAITLTFDSLSGIWSPWTTTVNGLSYIDLVGWTKRGGESERFGEGILSNGDLISVNDNHVPQDTLLGSVYVTDGYVATGYVENTSDSGTPINFKIRFGVHDGQTNRYKFAEHIRAVGDLTPNSQTLTLRWSDGNSDSFNTGRSLDTSHHGKARRMGRYRRRNYETEYSGTDMYELEALEGEVEVSND